MTFEETLAARIATGIVALQNGENPDTVIRALQGDLAYEGDALARPRDMGDVERRALAFRHPRDAWRAYTQDRTVMNDFPPSYQRDSAQALYELHAAATNHHMAMTEDGFRAAIESALAASDDWEYGVKYAPGYEEFDNESLDEVVGRVRRMRDGGGTYRDARVIRRRRAGQPEELPLEDCHA